MLRPSGLNGKYALVTGAAQGIGASIVERLTEEGVRVIAIDLPGKDFEFVERVPPESVELFPLDLLGAGSEEKLLELVGEKFGSLDILVNNAGVINAPKPVTEVSSEELIRILEINLVVVHRLCAAFIPLLSQRQNARIINIGSLNSLLPAPGFSPYVISKHGVLGLTRNIAVEFGAAGITANCILPGAIKTPMSEKIAANVPGYDDAMLQRTPVGRRGTPADVAEAVAFLASDGASFITGHGLVVDGGIGLGA